MILDSSAIIAIALREPGYEELVGNFGDCLSYAAARLADRPLLFVGDDFPRTDIGVA